MQPPGPSNTSSSRSSMRAMSTFRSCAVRRRDSRACTMGSDTTTYTSLHMGFLVKEKRSSSIRVVVVWYELLPSIELTHFSQLLQRRSLPSHSKHWVAFTDHSQTSIESNAAAAVIRLRWDPIRRRHTTYEFLVRPPFGYGLSVD